MRTTCIGYGPRLSSKSTRISKMYAQAGAGAHLVFLEHAHVKCLAVIFREQVVQVLHEVVILPRRYEAKDNIQVVWPFAAHARYRHCVT